MNMCLSPRSVPTIYLQVNDLIGVGHTKALFKQANDLVLLGLWTCRDLL